jgi:hypothetical protein
VFLSTGPFNDAIFQVLTVASVKKTVFLGYLTVVW